MTWISSDNQCLTRENVYHYDHLERASFQIRIMYLFPAKDVQADIYCSIRTISLHSRQDHHPYDAISYAWGDHSKPKSIFLDSKVMHITENLDSALRHLRRRKRQRVMWVDDICINQSNDREKTHQVRQMLSIYRNATRVVIWLGTADDDVEFAIRSHLQKDYRNRGDSRDLALPGLGKIFRKPWWSRMWVIQEVLGAEQPIMMCGGLTLPWSATMMTLLLLSLDAKPCLPPNSDMLDTFASMVGFGVHTSQGELSFKDLLKLSCGRKASDPRDHVYALYGIAAKAEIELPEPDYSVSVTTAYQRAMVAVFESSGDLNWLRYTCTGDPTKPSWCLDFSTPWTSMNYDQVSRASPVDDEVSFTGQERLRIKHDAEKGTLSILGTEIGRIDKTQSAPFRLPQTIPIGHDMTSTANEQNLLWNSFLDCPHRTLGDFVSDALTALTRRVGHDSAIRKIAAGHIWKTAACGELYTSFDEYPDSPTGPEVFQMLGEHSLNTDPARRNLSSDWAQFIRIRDSTNVRNIIHDAFAEVARDAGRSDYLFTTDTGYIGLSCGEIRSEDQICVLFGLQIPAVLRPLNDGAYTLVTFAYVDDVVADDAVTEDFINRIRADDEKDFLVR